MKNLLYSAAIAVGIGTTAHGSSHEMMVGRPGNSSAFDREVTVSMRETDEGQMIFEPSEFAFKTGETIQFKVENEGELEHEFILDTPVRNAVHLEIMTSRMETHSSSNALTLAPGDKNAIIWIFTNSGIFEFACLIPGHFEAGMFGKIVVR